MAKPKTLEQVTRLVSSVDLLIYAPPAYGKTAYQTNRRKQLDLSVFDTDDLDCPDDSHLEVLITNYHQLIPSLESQLVIAFVPDEKQFRSGCEMRGLKYKTSWYSDILDSLQLAGSNKDIILINSGAPILFYERFIHSCVMAIWDCGPLPKVPSPPSSPQKPVTMTKKQVEFDIDTLDPKVMKIVEPIQPGPQLMYKDTELEEELDAICLDIQSDELPSSSRTRDRLPLSQPIPEIQRSRLKRRVHSESETSSSRHSKVQCVSRITVPQTEKQKRFVARIFALLCELKLPVFNWNIKEDYNVSRGSVKFKSFGNFVTCTDGTFQFHCSRHLFLKWSH